MYSFPYLGPVCFSRSSSYALVLLLFLKKIIMTPFSGLCCAVLSHVWLFETPWTVDWQAPLSMEFTRQEYWSGLPFPAPGIFYNLGIKPVSLVSLYWQIDSLPPSHLGSLFSGLSLIPKEIITLSRFEKLSYLLLDSGSTKKKKKKAKSAIENVRYCYFNLLA